MFTVDRLNAVTADFQKYVEPQLYDSGMFDPDNSYVVVCEGDQDDLKTKMDMYAGIDMCTIDKEHQVVQGIASRIQWGTCWRTFTIRALTDSGSFDTELKKRSMAIKKGDMYPTWTMQAYIRHDLQDDTKILCTIGIIRTVDLFDYVMGEITDQHFTGDEFFDALQNQFSIGEVDVRKNYAGGAVFLTCNWDKLINHGVDIKILNGVFDS